MLSIIIPTHQRIEYAKKCIVSLNQLSELVEIIVSDSSTDTSLDDYKSLIKDSRHLVKVVFPEQGCSVVENFNHAVSFATGDYWIFIGDDDLVLNSIFDALEIMQKHEATSCTFTFPVNYYWPDFKRKKYRYNLSGKITGVPYSNRTEIVSLNDELCKATNEIGSGPLGLARAYCGIISKKTATEIIHKVGALFGGVSPDIYSSVLISFFSRKSILIDSPVVIPGQSGNSTSGHSAAGTHKGLLFSSNHMKPFFGKITWNSLIPKFYATQTVWAYSMCEALKVISYSGNINYVKLYAKCLISHPKYWREVAASLRVLKSKAKRWERFEINMNLIKYLISELCIRAFKLTHAIKIPVVLFKDVPDSKIAAKHLNKNIER